MNQKTTLIAAVAVCSAAGFMVGRISSQSTASPDPDGNGVSGQRAGSELARKDRSASPLGPRATGQSGARGRSISSNSTSAGDPIERMEEILNNPNPLIRAEEWLRFVKGLGPDEIEDVVANFRAKGMTDGNLSEYSMLLSTWAKYDPLAALDYASDNTRSPFARQTILTTWATTDPVAAMRWAEENYTGEGANPWMVGVIRGIAATDPARATQLMASMPYSQERGEALSAIIGHYLKQGPEAARAWAMGIEDERLRSGAISRVADSLARTDAKGAADWLVANPGDAATRAMGSVMQRMADADPLAAITYFERISDQDLKGSALEGLTDRIAAKDPQAALALMDSNPTLVTDDVVSEFIWSARREDPTLAANAISRIENAEERSRTYRQYMWRWMRSDMDAAVNWTNQSDLPDNVKRSLDTIRERMQSER